MEEGKEIGKGTLYIMLGKLAITFVGILNVTLVPRILGPENMGFYSYWLSVFFVLASILDLGGNLILSRYIPELRRRNPNSIIPLIKRTIEIKFLPALILLLAGFYILPKERLYFLIILIASIFHSIALLIQMGIYGYKDMKKYTLMSFSRVVIRLIFIITLFTIFGASGILFSILWGGILITAIFGFSLVKMLPKSSGKLEKPLKEYLTFGLFVYLGFLFSNMMTWVVVILAKEYIDDLAVIGFLGLALLMCLTALLNIVISVGEGVLPSLIEFHTIRDKNFGRAFELSWKYTNVILFPLLFGLLILSKPFILLVVSEEYLPTADLIKYFLPATAFVAWFRIHQQILLIFEKKKEIFITHLIGFVVFFISGLILIKNIGIIGAPISVSLGAFADFIYIYLVTSRIMKITSYLSNIIRPLIGTLCMSVLINLIEVTNIVTLFGTVILGAITYFVVMFLIGGIKRSDIKRVKGIF